MQNVGLGIVAPQNTHSSKKTKADFERFYQEKNDYYKNQVLYVGNAYKGMRPAVEYAINSHIPISIYGNFWNKLIDQKYIKGLYIDNNELHKYYSNADIVLNDTAPNMKKSGFISNRIYDVSACKGFIITDYMPEVEKIFGDAIPMYKNQQELKELVEYYLAHPEERKQKAQKAYDIVISHYTNLKIAERVKCHISSLDYKKHRAGLCDWYQRATGKELDLENPKTFNEKIQWLKLYDSTPIKTQLADKYLVRDWVKEKIGEEYLIPLLGVYDNFDEIDFDKLPEQFVIKCNHGCGYNIVVKDKATLKIIGL